MTLYEKIAVAIAGITLAILIVQLTRKAFPAALAKKQLELIEKDRVAKLQEENAILREQIRKNDERPADLKSINGIWWGLLDGESKLMPFCPRCSPDKWVPLEVDFRYANGRVRDDGQFSYACGACGNTWVRAIADEKGAGAVLELPNA